MRAFLSEARRDQTEGRAAVAEPIPFPFTLQATRHLSELPGSANVVVPLGERCTLSSYGTHSIELLVDDDSIGSLAFVVTPRQPFDSATSES